MNFFSSDTHADLMELDSQEDSGDRRHEAFSSSWGAASGEGPLTQHQLNEWQELLQDFAHFHSEYLRHVKVLTALLISLPHALDACRPTSCPLGVQQAMVVLSNVYKQSSAFAWNQRTSNLLIQLLTALREGQLSGDLGLALTDDSCFSETLERS